jgi:hypothetical protein
MRKRAFQFLWFLTVLVMAALSCNLISSIGQTAGGIEQTARSVATQVQGGANLAATGEAAITQVEGSGIVKTIQAAVTEQGPELQETIQAFATNQLPGLSDTVQAYVTAQGPGAEETMQAVATQAALSFGTLPEDIPVVEGEKDNYIKSENIVTYQTPLDLNSVKEFYTREMPVNGWSLVENQSQLNGNNLLLVYDKPDRKSNITLQLNPLGNQTIVIIAIENK